MKLNNYVKLSRGKQMHLARAINTQPQLVYQWANGIRPVPIERCVAIEFATGGQVTRKDLRPLDWWKIWPELVEDCVAGISVTEGISRPSASDDVAGLAATGSDEIFRAMKRRRAESERRRCD